MLAAHGCTSRSPRSKRAWATSRSFAVATLMRYGCSKLRAQKYEKLGMPHQTAIAELEIADIYAELNLNSEAAEIYRRLIHTLHRLKMRAEEARARANFGRTLIATENSARTPGPNYDVPPNYTSESGTQRRRPLLVSGSLPSNFRSGNYAAALAIAERFRLPLSIRTRTSACGFRPSGCAARSFQSYAGSRKLRSFLTTLLRILESLSNRRSHKLQ